MLTAEMLDFCKVEGIMTVDISVDLTDRAKRQLCRTTNCTRARVQTASTPSGCTHISDVE